jgi:hypothetical protein
MDRELDEKVRDALHLYIEARGINEKLFRFLQAWLYVKDHRNLVRWFKSVGSFISDQSQSKVHCCLCASSMLVHVSFPCGTSLFYL